MKNLRKIFSVAFFSLICAGLAAYAQEGGRESAARSITSDDFASQRPAAAKSGSTGRKNYRANSSRRRATYKFVRRSKPIVRKKQNRKPASNASKNQPEKISEVGINVWKLRPAAAADRGFKLPVQVDNARQMWTAERVSDELAFKPGDRVRLAVESSVSGYLYVINSEIYRDGTFGEPFLIFPGATDEDNSVEPGLLVDIPDQTEEFPYFVINPKKENYKGELLTVIISPKPLPQIKTDRDGRIKNLEELIDLELKAEADVYFRSDARDKIYTEEEARAACGAKARQLTRVKSSDNPCGAKSRQLTREEPLPQMIYRVKTIAGQPIVAFINLNVEGL